jgi:hypothetical protein
LTRRWSPGPRTQVARAGSCRPPGRFPVPSSFLLNEQGAGYSSRGQPFPQSRPTKPQYRCARHLRMSGFQASAGWLLVPLENSVADRRLWGASPQAVPVQLDTSASGGGQQNFVLANTQKCTNALSHRDFVISRMRQMYRLAIVLESQSSLSSLKTSGLGGIPWDTHFSTFPNPKPSARGRTASCG